MVIHWSLNKNKSPEVSRTLLSILVNLSNAIVWILSTRPLIAKSSCPFTNPLVTVPRAPNTIGITVTGGTCGVMVIVAGYGHGDTSSNPRPD